MVPALEDALASCTGLLQSPGVRWAFRGTFLALQGLFTLAFAQPQLSSFADAWLTWAAALLYTQWSCSPVSSPTHSCCRFLLEDKLLLHSLLPPLALHLLLELLARLQGLEQPIGSIQATAVRLAQASGRIMAYPCQGGCSPKASTDAIFKLHRTHACGRVQAEIPDQHAACGLALAWNVARNQ